MIEDHVTPDQFGSIYRTIVAASEAFGVSEAQIVSRDKHRRVADARHAAARIAYDELGHPLMRVGHVFRRDHATIRHSVIRARNLCESDPDFRARYERMLALLGNPPPVERADPYEQMLRSGDGQAGEVEVR